MRDDNLSVVNSTDNERVVSLREYAALERVLDDVLDRVERVELARNAAHKRIDDLENRLSEDEPQGSSGESESKESTTPLEDIADDEKENPPGVQVGPSVTRAAAIMSNWDKWSKRAPKGRTIRDGLKNLLETATGESLAWKQVYRACRKLEQLTKGRIVLTRTNRHGNILLQPSSAATS